MDGGRKNFIEARVDGGMNGQQGKMYVGIMV
jgi:hypothetical protein